MQIFLFLRGRLAHRHHDAADNDSDDHRHNHSQANIHGHNHGQTNIHGHNHGHSQDWDETAGGLPVRRVCCITYVCVLLPCLAKRGSA